MLNNIGMAVPKIRETRTDERIRSYTKGVLWDLPWTTVLMSCNKACMRLYSKHTCAAVLHWGYIIIVSKFFNFVFWYKSAENVSLKT